MKKRVSITLMVVGFVVFWFGLGAMTSSYVNRDAVRNCQTAATFIKSGYCG